VVDDRVGADAHKRSHMLAAVDAGTGALVAELEIKANEDGHRRVLRWARALADDRVWAIEDCRGLTGRLEQALLGGLVRLYELPEIVRVASPVYIKFGLRNAPDIYRSGGHLEATAVALSRERVRRARLGHEILRRADAHGSTSPRGAVGLAVPVAPR
jgi:hypothetical protein